MVSDFLDLLAHRFVSFLFSSFVFLLFLIALFFFFRWLLRFRFISSSSNDIIVLRKGVFALRIFPFFWAVLAILSISERRVFFEDLTSRGLSPNDVFVHNFSSLVDSVFSVPVDVFLVIKKERGKIHRYIIVSSKGFLLSRVYNRVVDVSNTIATQLSSIGFEASYAKKDIIRFFSNHGSIVISKGFLLLDFSESELFRVDSATLLSVKNLLLNASSDYTIILNYTRFPSVKDLKVSTEENRNYRNYRFGLYYFCDKFNFDRYHSRGCLKLDAKNIINNMLPIAKIKKLKKLGDVEKGYLIKFLSWPKKKISLRFDESYADKCRLMVFSSLLIFLLGSVEEEVLPKTTISDKLAGGDILIGHQLSGNVKIKPFYINLEDLPRHILIVGPTGAGKTSLTKIIIRQLMSITDGPSIWVFDFHGEYHSLRDMGFLVIEPGRGDVPLGLNIFDPIHEDYEIYSSFISSLLNELARGSGDNFSPQMERILSTAIYDVVVSEDDSKKNPLFFLYRINSICEELSSEIPSAKYTLHAIFNRLKILFSGVSKDVFWVMKTNLDIKELIDKNVVFDLSYFSSKEPTKKALWILVNVLLRYLYSYLIGKTNIRGEKPRLFIVLEEARYIAPAIRKEETATMYAAEDLTVLGRKYGVALCFVTQTANSISKDIVDNCGTIFMMGDAPSEVTKDMLTGTDTRYLQIMPPREALVKMRTKSVLAHLKLIDLNELAYDTVKDRKYTGWIVEMMKSTYKPIKEPYERFIRRLISREVTLHETLVK